MEKGPAQIWISERIARENAIQGDGDIKYRRADLCDPEPIRAVWEKYKHLDQLLSDEQWLDPSTPQRACLYDLWAAIVKFMEGEK